MTELPDLSNKILGLYLKDAPAAQAFMMLMETAGYQTHGGRTFLVGRIPEAELDSWVRGLTTAIAWDSVGYFLVFDSVEDARARLKRGRRPWWKRLLGRDSR